MTKAPTDQIQYLYTYIHITSRPQCINTDRIEKQTATQ